MTANKAVFFSPEGSKGKFVVCNDGSDLRKIEFLQSDAQRDKNGLCSLARCGFWKDDAQVVRETVEKRWSDEPAGIYIEIKLLEAIT